MKKIRIIEAVNQLGLGGTEYALQLYCKFLSLEFFDVTVVSLLKGGERVQLLKNLGIKVIVLDGDFVYLGDLLKETDVFHWHGGGSCMPDQQLFEALRLNKPKLVIQTNVFGAFDNSPYYSLIDYDLYISRMILIRRMKEDGDLGKTYLHKRKVLAYPVDTDHINSTLPASDLISQFKIENNLKGHFIVGRIGRADNHKFDLIALDGFALFVTKIKSAKFLLVGATSEMLKYAEKLGITDRLLVLDNTIDFQELLLYYKSMDVFLAASNIGESFGMVIAESMTIGTPVVTISTEDRDNAQIELVDNQRSGLVVKREKTVIASALLHLYDNKDIASEISKQAKKKIEKSYKAQNIVKSLEKLILNHFNLEVHMQYDNSLIQDYSTELVQDYTKRCTNLFGRSTFMEKIIWTLKHR